MFDDISFHFLVKPESRTFTRINPDTHKTETRSLNLSSKNSAFLYKPISDSVWNGNKNNE